MTDYPGKAESSAISITINNKIYVGGGSFGYGTQTNDLWEFDPAINTWQRKSDMPENLSQFKVFYESNGNINAFTTNAENQHLLLTYNPSTDLWTRSLITIFRKIGNPNFRFNQNMQVLTMEMT